MREARKKMRRGMLGLKQQDLYHLESNLCQLCLQVKQSNLTARVSTWGCGHVQGGVACSGPRVFDLHACVCVRSCIYVSHGAELEAQWCDAGVGSCCHNVCETKNLFRRHNSTTMSLLCHAL